MRRWLLVLAMAAAVAGSPARALAQDCDSTEMIDGFPTRRITYHRECASALSPDSPQARDGSRVELWAFEATTGDCVSIRMDARDFRTYLQLTRGTRNGPIEAEGRTSLQVRLRSTGTYIIKATSDGSGDRQGGYTLSVNAC